MKTKRTNNRMSDTKMRFIFITVTFLAGLVIGIWTEERKSSEEFEKGFIEIALMFTCLDGCYNMLELQYGNISYYNETLKDLHNKCGDMCWKNIGYKEEVRE